MDGKSEIDAMGAELLIANNLVAEREDTIVGLEEEIELLRKPNAKELKLSGEIQHLKKEMADLEENRTQLEAQLEAEEGKKQHWQREYDHASLCHEDWLATQRVTNFRAAEETNWKVTSLQTRINNQTKEIAELCQRVKASEWQLMTHEDSLVRKQRVAEGLQDEKCGLLNEVADCEERNVRKCYTIFSYRSWLITQPCTFFFAGNFNR
jgi:chromosome segregation ATPase